MGTILDVLRKIRKRPGLMLGRPSASNLYAFLSGYAFARKETEKGDYDVLASFNHWVHERYQVASVQNWAKIIEFYSATEADELPLFWKLFDEFEKGKWEKKKVS